MNRTHNTWEIRVEGLLDGRWSEWLNGMAITYVGDTDTILTGELADQTALYGLFERLRDLGLNLVSVRRVEEVQPEHPLEGE